MEEGVTVLDWLDLVGQDGPISADPGTRRERSVHGTLAASKTGPGDPFYIVTGSGSSLGSLLR